MGRTKIAAAGTNNTPSLSALFSEIYTELYVKILVIALICYILYYIVTFIGKTMKGGCKNHCKFLVQEGFTNFDDSKQYFINLSKRCDVVNDNISKLSTGTGELENSFGTLKGDVCYVTNQVDEGLSGNYSSNVPDEEQKYPPEEQKKRAEQRKANSVKYVANLKKTFVEAHGGTPLLECFSGGMSDGENVQLQTIRENLYTKISDTESNLTQFDNSLGSLNKEFSKEKLQQYYTTLNYNDKYIKQMQSAAVKNLEGFEDEVFDFKPVKQNDKKDQSVSLEDRVSAIEEHYNKSSKNYEYLNKTFKKYTNTTKAQTNQLKQAKKIVNDQDEQNKQMKANSGKAVKSGK
jgi:hypothetical protein